MALPVRKVGIRQEASEYTETMPATAPHSNPEPTSDVSHHSSMRRALGARVRSECSALKSRICAATLPRSSVTFRTWFSSRCARTRSLTKPTVGNKNESTYSTTRTAVMAGGYP